VCVCSSLVQCRMGACCRRSDDVSRPTSDCRRRPSDCCFLPSSSHLPAPSSAARRGRTPIVTCRRAAEHPTAHSSPLQRTTMSPKHNYCCLNTLPRYTRFRVATSKSASNSPTFPAIYLVHCQPFLNSPHLCLYKLSAVEHHRLSTFS